MRWQYDFEREAGVSAKLKEFRETGIQLGQVSGSAAGEQERSAAAVFNQVGYMVPQLQTILYDIMMPSAEPKLENIVKAAREAFVATLIDNGAGFKRRAAQNEKLPFLSGSIDDEAFVKEICEHREGELEFEELVGACTASGLEQDIVLATAKVQVDRLRVAVAKVALMAIKMPPCLSEGDNKASGKGTAPLNETVARV